MNILFRNIILHLYYEIMVADGNQSLWCIFLDFWYILGLYILCFLETTIMETINEINHNFSNNKMNIINGNVYCIFKQKIFEFIVLKIILL